MSTEHLLGDVSAILEGLIGLDNQHRQEAETRLSQLTAESPGPLLHLLSQVGAQGVGGFQVDSRLLALILLRRLAFTEHAGLFLNPEARRPTAPFDVIPEATRGRIERVLTAGLEDEMDVRLRKGLGVCVGEWVKGSDKRQRPFHGLPSILLKLAASPRPFHRFSPFQLLDAAPALLSMANLTGHSVPAGKVAELLLGGINDPSVDVRIEALRAARGVLHDGMTSDERDSYGPSLLAASFEAIPALPLNVLKHGLEPMIDVASSFPHLFTNSLHFSVPFLVMCIAPPSTLPGHAFSRYPHREMEWDEWCDMSSLALEVLFSLVIADPMTASHWEAGHLVSDIVDALIGRQVAAFAAEGEQCQEWIAMEDLEDDDETYPTFPEEMLNRFGHIMKSHTVLEAVAHQSSKLMHRSEWRARYCSLMAIASISEGSYEIMQAQARTILELISPAAVDEHPRVRYGFLYCIGQLCYNLDGVLQREFADAVLDIMLSLLDDPVTRVQAAAAAAMVHFFDLDNLPSFEDRLRPILERLVSTLQRGPLYIQEEVLATIAAVASQEGKAFLPFYRDVMDFNLGILATATDASQHKFVCRAMRCAAQLGQAVGKEHFYPDAVPLCQALLVIQNQATADDDLRRAALADAWTIIARIIGKDFAPFLQFVIPPVLQSASYIPDATTDEEWYDQSLSAEMQEKEEAFLQLSTFVTEMREAYAPWLTQTMNVALAAVTSKWSDGVREAACFLVPGLLQVAKDAKIWVVDSANLETLFRTLINAIPHEEEAQGVGQLYQSIGDCLRVMEIPLPEANVAHLGRATLEWLKTIYERRLERAGEQHASRQRGDYYLWAEAEQYEEAAEDEALTCMDTAFGRVVRRNSHALGAMGEIAELAQKVKGAACVW